MISLHVAATALHYGQEAFEGLKVFTQKDGSVSAFRPDQNAQRLNSSARRLLMEEVPQDLFLEALTLLARDNSTYIPPYGTGASFYVRPLLIGTTPRIGVQPADEYDLYMLGMPVGPYYKDGFYPVQACIQDEFDRAAPHGVGNVKAGGNYAAGMMGDLYGKKRGYPISLYLDSASHQYIDEFGTSNFIGITDDATYVTPKSPSILPSITNVSLQTLAQDMGMRVEKRPVHLDELTRFREVGACGTAAVITPVYSIVYGDTTYTYGTPDTAGETLTKLYEELQGIQYGDREDPHQWMYRL
ncbi:branched chain amino acid aminotransferase [Chitinivibrio alkaliphilus ACht1]|uniref:branched-chain-amino-acid transaminase n=2 Tax=Chitinivibrio TaxID=1505231 RepID=U7DAM3_9BACT|nr:branched chain amino acid aminotransferase [Chitinivibrio alkaliphilus ACht1]